jgi:hypothetical protein
MPRVSIIALGLLMALPVIASAPVTAQETGGLRAHNQRDPYATLNAIQANRGCPQSSTSVSIGVNKATQFGSSATQQLSSSGRPMGDCHPLVSTSVMAGANLALGGRSTANQTIDQQAPRGVLSNNLYTRGVNLGFGSQSTANQHLSNQIGR